MICTALPLSVYAADTISFEDENTDSGCIDFDFNHDVDWDEANNPPGVVDEYDDSPIEDDLSNSGLGIDEWVNEEPNEDTDDYEQTPSQEDNQTDGGVANDIETSSPNTGNTSSAIAVASLCGALCLGVISRKKK